ncbi:acetyl-CoA carboxylase carboxyl transferase subunit alpha, partial [Escherichia coli]|nr:acetyl-CoA carboxylase carboxyl transferase subunit alpha [Escherichia coli]
LWKDATLAKQAAETMKITAPDLKELGIVDEVVEEVKGGAHRNIDEQAAYMEVAIRSSLQELTKLTKEQLVEERYEKYKKIG